MTISLSEAYRRRPIRFIELWSVDRWRMKVYGIRHGGEAPRGALVAAARDVAERRLREASAPAADHGIGFIGIHDGRTANFVFVDWWAEENELHHHVYVSPTDRPGELKYVTPTGLAACVWDLRVIGFERDAWVETVLANPGGPDVEAYLARRLNEDV